MQWSVEEGNHRLCDSEQYFSANSCILFYISPHSLGINASTISTVNVNSIIFSRSLPSFNKPTLLFFLLSVPFQLSSLNPSSLRYLLRTSADVKNSAVFSTLWDCCDRIQWKSEKEFFLTHGTRPSLPSIAIRHVYPRVAQVPSNSRGAFGV